MRFTRRNATRTILATVLVILSVSGLTRATADATTTTDVVEAQFMASHVDADYSATTQSAPTRSAREIVEDAKEMMRETIEDAMESARLSLGAIGAPGPQPPRPPRTHKKPYGNPQTGQCEAREVRVQIQNIPGDFCSPSCSVASPCPEDTYKGATARGMCVLQTPGAEKPNRCALVCNPRDPANGGCPKGSECHPVAQVGICTYPM
jgi:hypothetical protein